MQNGASENATVYIASFVEHVKDAVHSASAIVVEIITKFLTSSSSNASASADDTQRFIDGLANASAQMESVVVELMDLNASSPLSSEQNASAATPPA